MITVRKVFLSDICVKYKIDSEKEKETELKTKCHEDFFYILDEKNKCGLWVINSSVEIHSWYRVSPFQHFFQELMSVAGKQIVHAGVIANNEFGVLLTGDSGAGKTTTTLHAVLNGYRYLSEDYCILSWDQNRFTAHSLYNAIKLTDKSNFDIASQFNHDPIVISAGEKVKKAFFLSKHPHAVIAKKTPIRAIVSLKITTNTSCDLKKDELKNAIKSLAFSTIGQNPIYANQAIKNFYEFSKKVPLFQLCLSRQLEKNTSAIGRLFDELSA